MIDFADAIGIELMPWQKWVLKHMLELLLDGGLRFRTVIVLVARQNGKTLISQILALWFLVAFQWPVVLGTAQDLDKAEDVWDGVVQWCTELDENDEPVRPELYEIVLRVSRVNGKKALETTFGTRYRVKAANRRSARGLSGNLILLDELREHQSWDAWSAVTKTTNAQTEALILCLSNAGDATSVVLRHLRLMAHEALGDPDGVLAADRMLEESAAGVDVVDEEAEADDFEQWEDEFDADTLALFEWSAVPECYKWVRDGGAQANPALGYRISERTLASDCRTDPEHVFRPECLCQWLESSASGPFPPGMWELGKLSAEAFTVPDLTFVDACVDFAHDRSSASVAVVVEGPHGKPFGLVVAKRAGVDWVLPWLLDAEHPHRQTWRICAQSAGAPVTSLVPELKAARYPDPDDPGDELALDFVEWKGDAVPSACGVLFDRVTTLDEAGRPGFWHRPQPSLDIAAGAAASRPLGDGWAWSRRLSPVDVSSLVAVTGALWLFGQPIDDDGPSAYEEHGLEVV